MYRDWEDGLKNLTFRHFVRVYIYSSRFQSGQPWPQAAVSGAVPSSGMGMGVARESDIIAKAMTRLKRRIAESI
jgi:hypothetical protein